MTKLILIDSSFGLIRTAISEGGKLLDYYEESPDQGRCKGNIYKGLVKKVEGHIQAAFVRYGTGRDGFLPLRDGMSRGDSDPDRGNGSADEEHETEVSAGHAPGGEAPAGEAPGSETRLDDGPGGEASAGVAQEGETSTGESPFGEAWGDGMSPERGPDGRSPGDGTPAGEPPGDDALPGNSRSGRRPAREARGRASQVQGLRGGKRRKPSQQRQGGGAEPAKKSLGPGDSVLVQVVKDEVGGKGAALTTRLSLSGRYLVYMPDKVGEGGISSRVGDEERSALKKAMSELRVPAGASIILRTAALGKPAAELQADLDRLVENHREILAAAKAFKEPGLVYREAPPAQRYLREYYTSDVDRIWVNSEELLEECRQFFRLYEPKAVAKVSLSKDGMLMFQKLGLEGEVEKLSARKVSLPSGANFVIDQTEALVAIDVNSARSRADGAGKGDESRASRDGEEKRGERGRGRRDLEESVFAINMEAAGEIARQLRLRDLGGIIIVDFIDMEEDGHRRKVEAAMRRALAGDKAKVKVFDITPLGLLQISRQRLRKAGPHFSHAACEACHGRGWHASPAAAASAVIRRLEEKVRARRSPGAWTVTVPFPVANRLMNEFRPYVLDMEDRHGCAIRILADGSAAGEPVFSSAPEPLAPGDGAGSSRARGRAVAGGGMGARTDRRAAAPAPVEAAVSIPDSGVVAASSTDIPSTEDASSDAIFPSAADAAFAPEASSATEVPSAEDISSVAGVPGRPGSDGPASGGQGGHAKSGSHGRRGRGRRGGRHHGRGQSQSPEPHTAQPPAARVAPVVRTPPQRRREAAEAPDAKAGISPAAGNAAAGPVQVGTGPAATGNPARGEAHGRQAAGKGGKGGGSGSRGGGGEGETGKRRRSRHRSRRGGGSGGKPASAG